MQIATDDNLHAMQVHIVSQQDEDMEVEDPFAAEAESSGDDVAGSSDEGELEDNDEEQND